MKKFDILVMGELNIDLILNRIQAFPKVGTEVLAKDMVLTLGSSSAIFASNASSLGSRVAFLGKVGHDYFGSFIIDALKAKNVGTQFVIRSSDYVTGATVVLNFGEDRAMVTHPGAMEFLSGENLTPGIVEHAKHLHVSSVFLQPLLKRDLPKILRMAKEHGLTTSLDTQWDPHEKWDLDLPALLPHVDVFMPNEEEFLALAGTRDLEAGLQSLGKLANIIVVKQGSKGSIAYTKGKKVRVEAFLNREVVDSIGAGDSFCSGFVSKFILGAPLETCLKFGNLTGALNTTAAGGTSAFSSSEKIQSVAKAKFGVDISSI